MKASLAEKAQHFRTLHERDGVFVMPNAWDAGSARLLASAGFEALATTSGGVNYARGRQDYVYEVPAEEMLAEYGLIADAVDLPVSGDLENGYGDDPQTVAHTIRRSAELGMVGGGIEDWTGDPDHPLYETGLAVERIAAAREAADATGIDYTLTARCEIYSFDLPNRFSEAVRRANVYADAGAHCVFVPGMNDREDLRRFCSEVSAPVSFVAGLGEVGAEGGGPPLTVAELADIGVRRISTGGSLYRTCFGALQRAAEELGGEGTFGYTKGAIPDPEINAFMKADS